eukprot:4740062-Prymnesium_polylepis.1
MPRRARRQSQPLWVNVHTPFTRTALTPPAGRCSHTPPLSCAVRLRFLHKIYYTAHSILPRLSPLSCSL